MENTGAAVSAQSARQYS